MAKYKDITTGEIIEVGSPELNPDLIAGKTKVPDNTPFSVITSNDLAPTPSVDYKSPSPTSIPDVSKLDTSVLELTKEEKKADDLSTRLQEMQNSLLGQSAFRGEKEKELNVEELRKTQTDLSARLKAVQNEAQAIPLQLQEEAKGRGITAGGLAPLQTERLRANAIQALSVSSLLEASRGNLTTALDMVDRAVAAKYDPIKEKNSVLLANLELILKSPSYTLADKNRAEVQKAKIAAQTKLDEKKELEEKEIGKIAVDAAKQGVDALTLKKIQEAKTSQEALSLAAPFMKEVDLGAKEKVKTSGAVSPEILLSTSKANVDSIQNILNSGGLSISVGTSLLTKNQPGFWRNLGKVFTVAGIPAVVKGVYKNLTGEQQDFIASTEQIRSQLNLDKLIQSKAQGATFGALSDNELQVLASAGTKLGTWAVKDGDGKVVGYNASESAFKKEMDKINNFAKLDYIIKGGDPADVNAKIMPDGAVWTSNSDGTYTQIK